MKSVGKQLEEARLAKSWTAELAARETKIKVDRIHDLEADDYSHFSSPTYARGFVRTYARALGLDEYRLLRQLDNKLPEDDNATFVQDAASLPYVPETTKVIHASSAHRTGLYIFLGLGVTLLFVMAFVVFEAYRAGELPRYFAASAGPDIAPATNAAPLADADAPLRAKPVDPNDTNHAPRAEAVDLSQINPAGTNTAPAAAATVAPAAPAAPAPAPAPAAAPAVAATTPPDTNSDIVPNAPRALPVDLSQLAAANNSVPAHVPAPTPAVASKLNPPPAAPVAASSPDTNSDIVPNAPRALPVDPSELVAEANPPPAPGATPDPNATTNMVTPVDLTGDRPVQESMAEAQAKKRLILTASRDSYLRVTALDAPQGGEVLYDSVLRAGQSLAFGGRKFSVDVGVPSAVDIALDGVNYGPHSEGNSPETFTIESHQP